MAVLVKDFTTESNRKILVIDYAVSEDMANMLYQYFHYHVLWNHDNNENQDGDNVNFIHTLTNEKIEDSPLWELLIKYITKFFGRGYRPYNCSVNLTRFGDAPLMHRDTYDEEAKDVTLLLYLNPFWNQDLSGETVYFDERGEIELSVLPKFCRLAIHEGYVNHASRSPSRIFNGTRYTLAIKATPDDKYRSSRLDEDDQPQSASDQTTTREDDVKLNRAELEQRIFGNALT